MASKQYYRDLISQTTIIEKGGEATKPKPWAKILAAILGVLLLGAIAAFAIGHHHGPDDQRRAAVFIVAEFDNGFSLGSGAIVTSTGYIITNRHVIQGEGGIPPKKVTVWLDSGTPTHRTLTAVVKDYIKSSTNKTEANRISQDWAILKIEGKDLPFFKLADSRPAKLPEGTIVKAIGFPSTVIPSADETGPACDIAEGKVTSFLPNDEKAQCIVHDCNIQHGNSGGPLINITGEMVGINTAVSNDQDTGSKKLAIPMHMLKAVWDTYHIPYSD